MLKCRLIWLGHRGVCHPWCSWRTAYSVAVVVFSSASSAAW